MGAQVGKARVVAIEQGFTGMTMAEAVVISREPTDLTMNASASASSTRLAGHVRVVRNTVGRSEQSPPTNL